MKVQQRAGFEVVDCSNAILIDEADYEALIAIKERCEMKIRQLERDDCDDFGGLGTGESIEARPKYIRALRWAIGKEMGPV